MRRKKKNTELEEMPLMASRPSGSGKNPSWHGSYSDEDQDETDDLQWLRILASTKKKTIGNALLAADAILLLLHYIQLYAVIQSLSIRWPWPEILLRYTKYVFLLNADIWEFCKLHKGLFNYVQDYFFPSADIGVDYMHLMAAWGGLLFLLIVIYITCYSAFSRQHGPKTTIRLAMLKRVLIVALQVLSIPVGTFLCRLFHCNNDTFVDVKNELYCFRDIHWAYIAPALFVLLLVFIAYPAWLIFRTNDELMKMTSHKHESYLLLKEMEYIHGLDITWVVGNYHIFAPFKNSAAHLRAAQSIIWAIVLIAYASLIKYAFAQAVALICIFFVAFLAFCFLQPFRVKAFNVMLIISYLCLSINCLMGCFKTSYDSSSIQSAWLLPRYQLIILLVINGFWLFCALVFILYLIKRTCCCQRRQESLWPVAKFEKLSAETRKYMRSIIISRLLVEKTLSIHPMFAPIHEVARYIHIINAYCREAEQIRDPLQTMLWDVLDELIEVHTNIAPKCLFAESTKDTIRKTATDFLDLMPAFVSRLAQREYDFILIRPVKRRILLKLYCLSLFLKGCKVRQDHRQLTVPAIQKIWHKQSDEESDPGYYEDMYPPKEPIVPHRVFNYDADVLIRLEDDQSDDDSFIIEETEEWLKKHGIGGTADVQDPLDDWMGEMDVSADRPESVISDMVLPGNFAIPGMTYTEDSIWESDAQSVGTSRPLSAAAGHIRASQDHLNGAAPRSISSASIRSNHSQSLQPVTRSRPSSAMSTATLVSSRPGSAMSSATLVSSRPGSAMSTATLVSSRPGSSTHKSSGSRPGSAAPVDLLSVDESLPGAIITEENLTPRGDLHPGSAVSDQLPRPNSVISNMSQRGSKVSLRSASPHSKLSSPQEHPGSADKGTKSSNSPVLESKNTHIDVDSDEDILV